MSSADSWIASIWKKTSLVQSLEIEPESSDEFSEARYLIAVDSLHMTIDFSTKDF